MSSKQEMAALIGKRGAVTFDLHFSVQVEVLNVKAAYGVLRYYIRPISGSGEGWVNADRVTLDS